MSKTKISQYDAVSGNNTDIDGINLAEGMAPGLVNNAIRELMAQLKDFQVGAVGDSLTVGGNLVVTGTATVSGRTVDALPAGTKMLFQQTAAPVGWVKDVSNDNKALRIVSGAAGTGGSIAFTTAFGSQNVGDTALTTAQLPSHTHAFSGNTGNNNVGHNHTGSTDNHTGHQHIVPNTFGNNYSQAGIDWEAATGTTSDKAGRGDLATNPNRLSSMAGGHNHNYTTGNNSVNHLHAFSGTTAGTGSGAVHNHSLNLDVQYVDVIVATKS